MSPNFPCLSSSLNLEIWVFSISLKLWNNRCRLELELQYFFWTECSPSTRDVIDTPPIKVDFKKHFPHKFLVSNFFSKYSFWFLLIFSEFRRSLTILLNFWTSVMNGREIICLYKSALIYLILQSDWQGFFWQCQPQETSFALKLSWIPIHLLLFLSKNIPVFIALQSFVTIFWGL